MSMPHRCQCRICNRYMDGLGHAWDQQTECRHEGPFSTMRFSTTRKFCYVCGKDEKDIQSERTANESSGEHRE